MSNRRVVVTGIGAVTPLGNDIEETWKNAVKGVSGAGPITRFNAEKFKTKFACEVNGFDPSKYLEHKEVKNTDLYAQYGIYAAVAAFENAGLSIEVLDSPYDAGVIWSTGQGGMHTLENEMKSYVQRDFDPRFNPFLIPKFLANMASGLISIKLGLMGLNYTAVAACAGSNTAIMDAFNYIKLGKAKVIITGGSDAGIHESSIGGFNSLKALSTQNDTPESASKPFDVHRDGFVMGEGGAALVLEDYEHAKNRGAKIYAEVAGAGMTADAYHMTATHPDGEGAYHSMKFALEEAGIAIEELDYLNAHATSTPLGDVSEMKAVDKFFKGVNNNLQVSATKSMTGHLLGAAGAVEAIFAVKAIQENIIPPTINTEEIDPELPSNINLVCKEAKEQSVNTAMSNTFGFGGHNSTVVFKAI